MTRLPLALAMALLVPFTTGTAHAQAQPQQAAPTSTDPGVTVRTPLPEPSNPALPSLYLVGDSTVRNGKADGANGQWGWGEPLVGYFNTARLNVVNRAIGGRSSRTYMSEGRWQEVLDRVKPGDFILLQFGHNDGGALDDAARARGTLKGTGDEVREIDNPILKQHETVHTYGWYIDKYVRDARSKGVTLIVCSLVPRKMWKDSHIVRNSGEDYGGWAQTIAQRDHVPFIDLNEIVAREYDAMGQDRVEAMFADPHTHTSLAGAQLNARAVITGLKMLHPDPLAPYFSPASTDVPDHMLPAKP